MQEEQIDVFKPDISSERMLPFYPKRKEQIESPFNGGLWGAYTKHFLLGELGNRRRPVHLVIKRVYDAPAYYQKWRVLKNLGIPSIGSLRVARDKEHVLMTDLSVFKAQSYGKERYFYWDDLHGSHFSSHEFNLYDKLFAQIPLEKIISEIRRIQHIASKNGIILPGDDPFDLFVFLDGSWQVLVLDLSELEIIPISYFTQKDIDLNDKLASEFISKIEHMYQSIQSVVAPGLEPGTSRM